MMSRALRDPANRIFIILGLVFAPLAPAAIFITYGIEIQAALYMNLLMINVAVLLIAIGRDMRRRRELSLIRAIGIYCLAIAFLGYIIPTTVIDACYR